MSNEAFVTPDIRAVMGVVDTFLRWRSSNGPPRGFEIYHPSAFGKCLRCMQYLRYAERGYIQVEEECHESKLLRLFDKGHNMHDRWAKYMEAIGVLRGYWKCANLKCGQIFGKDDPLGCFKPERCESCDCNKFHYNEVSVVDKELNFYGHADMIIDFSVLKEDRFGDITKAFSMESLPKNPFVIDMKTCNDFKFKKILQHGPSLDYRVQLTIYANLLPVEFGLLIYENKNNSDTAAYKIEKNTDTVFKLIRRQAKSMNEMTDLKLLPPPRPLNKDDYECSKCGCKNICHNSKIWDDPKLII